MIKKNKIFVIYLIKVSYITNLLPYIRYILIKKEFLNKIKSNS